MKGIIAGTFLCLISGVISAAQLPFAPLPEQPPIPADNPMSAAKVKLGQQLFFDLRLSVNGSRSCNSCHNVAGNGADGRALSEGVYGRRGQRNTPTLWNAAYHTVYNWDGSAKTLEAQFQRHLLDATVMGMPDATTAVKRIESIEGYRQQFAEVFPTAGLTFDTLAKAVSSYLRTLVTLDSPYDRYLRGDEKAISKAAARGFKTFVDVRCAACHFWVNMAGPNPGLALQQGDGFYELFPNYPDTDYEYQYHLADDLGRYHYTLDETDRRMWRVASLRNIALSAPYFHNGAVNTLPEAVRVMAKTQLKRELTDMQVDDIVEFLKTLSGTFPQQSLPQLPGRELRSAVSGFDH